MKLRIKEEAIKLRKKGFSYSEILKHFPVAKSTLSLWLRSVNLTKRQQQKLSYKKLEAGYRGGQKRKLQRIESEISIRQHAISEIQSIDKNSLLLMGIMLYWAEGAKSKVYRPSQGIIFSNSDPLMSKFFLKWLKKCLKISDERLVFEIYIHENHKASIFTIKSYWANATGFHINKFDKIYYKKHNISTGRRNIDSNYRGLLRIRVKRSTDLNRRIAGWIEGACIQCGIV